MVITILVFLLVGVLIWMLVTLGGGKAVVVATGNTSFDRLRTVSVLEMPDLAAQIIAETSPTDVDAKVVEVLKSVHVLARPGVLPFVVDALLRQFPDKLDLILGTAVNISPDLVLVYAQGAVTVLPGRVEDISCALGKSAPEYANDIARTLCAGTWNVQAVERGLKRGIPNYQPPSDDTLDYQSALKPMVASPGGRQPLGLVPVPDSDAAQPTTTNSAGASTNSPQ